jgi:hypothetical protein
MSGSTGRRPRRSVFFPDSHADVFNWPCRTCSIRSTAGSAPPGRSVFWQDVADGDDSTPRNGQQRMARPNFHDRSWQDIDWDTWGPQFSITDRATSLRELQNGIATRYMEVQDLLSQLPPHAGRAQSLVALWRLEVNGYGRTVLFSESSQVLRRLDDLHGQVTAQLHAARQAAKAARKLRQRTLLAGAGPRAAVPGQPSHRSSDHDDDHFEGMRHSAATSRQRSDDPQPGQQTAAMRWATVQAAMARECDGCIADSARPVTAKPFRTAVEAAGDAVVEQFQPVRENGMVRIVVAGKAQYWTTGLPNLEQLGIARYSIYRRIGGTRRFEYVTGIRRPEDWAAEREAAERRPPGGGIG